VPEIEPTSPLQSLLPELSNYRNHMTSLLQSWEKDNMLIYFDKVRAFQEVEYVIGCAFLSFGYAFFSLKDNYVSIGVRYLPQFQLAKH
jgi:hypothetical protein